MGKTECTAECREREICATGAVRDRWSWRHSGAARTGHRDLDVAAVFPAPRPAVRHHLIEHRRGARHQAANSSPPAYGVWKQTGPGQFETKYLFYQTRTPVEADGPGNGGAWLPAGHGELTESITLSADGNSYTSKLHYASFDEDGKPQEGGGEATGAGTRIVF